MRKIRRPCYSLALGLLLCASSAALSQTQAENRLDQLLQGIQTLSADVLQLIIESDGGVLEESEIQMHIKRPNGFYWETLQPFPELVVTDGLTLWNYQPDLEQVVIEDWDSSRSELAAQLLSGETEKLKQEYLVSQVSPASAEFEEFSLHPIAADSVYESITIGFAEGILNSIHLANKNGEQTLWQFSAIVRNERLDDSLFQFDPPTGIEVVDNSGLP